MKIAVWHNLPSGGGKRALYGHLKGLVERGHVIEIYCPDTADRDYLPLDGLGVVHWLPLPRKGRHFAWANCIFPNYRLKLMQQMLWHCREAAEQIAASACDVVFVNSCRFFYMSLLGPFLQRPAVLYLGEPYRWHHEAFPENPWLLDGFQMKSVALPSFWLGFLRAAKHSFEKRLQITYEIEAAKSYEAILVNSLFSRESVLRAYGQESHVCYLGVDTKLFRPGDGQRGDYIVGSGSVARLKGPDRVVRALAHVAAPVRPRLRWICNGEDKAYRSLLEQTAADAGVRLEILRDITDAEVVHQLQNAIAMVYTPRLEPFGLAPLEANACGTPVVALAEGGVRETVRNGINGILVDDPDPGKLGAALETLVTNQELRQRLSQQAVRYIHDHWDFSSGIERLESNLLHVAQKERFA